MNPCIIYATKNGSTKKAAEKISQKLGGCDIFNIAEDKFDLSKYDMVIIGSNIRMGTVNKLITKLLLEFIKPLTEMHCAYFLCCAFSENGDGYFERNIPSQLLKKAVAVSAVGGELDESKLKGTDKMIAKMVMRGEKEKNITRKFTINDDSIDEFVDKLKMQP